MKEGVGTQRVLYVLLLSVPFAAGGYLVWCSALASCVLLGILCGRGRGGGAADSGCQEKPDYAMIAMICLPAALLLAFFWGVDRGQACFGFVKFVPLPLFLAAVRRLPEKGRAKLWEAVPLGGIIMTVVSILMWCIPAMRGWVVVNGRLAGLFQYPNTYAVYLLCGLLVKAERHSLWKGRDRAGCLVLMAGLLLSGSRTALVLAGTAAGILLLHSRRKSAVRAFFFVFAGSLALFLLILTVMGNLAVLERYLILPVRSSTFLGRILYVTDASPVIAWHPLGLGYMGYYFRQGSFQTGVYATRHIHNELLQLLMDAGWLPAAAVLCAVWKAFWRLGYHKRILLAVLLSHSLFDFDFQFLSAGFILVLLLAGEESSRTSVCDRKAVFKKAAKNSCVICGKRTAAIILAVLCLWIGTADFLVYLKRPEIAVRVYPAHTESWMEMLAGAETPEAMEQIANRILRYNQSVSLAYDAKAIAAYADGDVLEMVASKQQAIALARYEMAEYEDYFERLFIFYGLYMDAGMESSAAYCRERLLEIPVMLEQVRETSSFLAWQIYEKPQLELTENMRRKLAMLQDGGYSRGQ